MYNTKHCGSELARDNGATFNTFVDCHTAIASKPAPTRDLCRSGGLLYNRPPLTTYNLIQVAFSSVYLSNACRDLSRPLPDCLKPPNGAVMSPPSYWLTHTLPARSARAVRCALEMSPVQTAAA